MDHGEALPNDERSDASGTGRESRGRGGRGGAGRERADGSSAAVVAADAQTGKPLWTTGPGTFTGMPTVCSDDTSAVCLSGVLASDTGDEAALRFDIATGRRLPAAQVTGPGPRELAVGLYDTGVRHPEKLMATRGAKVAWSRPLARIFPMRGATTDYGWDFDRIDRIGLFVGSVGTTPTNRHGRVIFERTRSMSVGFRIADGVVRWRAPGALLCGYLTCAGDPQAGYSSPEQAQAGPTVGLRAVERGSVSYSRSKPDAPAIVSRDARGWCRKLLSYRQTAGFTTDVGTSHTYIGQYALVACAARSKHRLAPPPTVPAWVGDVGARSAGLVAWSDTAGVIAAPAGY